MINTPNYGFGMAVTPTKQYLFMSPTLSLLFLKVVVGASRLRYIVFPIIIGAGYQLTIPTNKGHFQQCVQPVVATGGEPLVATSVGTHRSMVARTSKCGWATSRQVD